MVIIVSISIIVTILIRNRVMKQLGVTTVQLFLKVPSALLSAEIFQSHGYFERTKKKDFIVFAQTEHRVLLMRLLKAAMISMRTVDPTFFLL